MKGEAIVGLKKQMVTEAAHGILAERLHVDIATAERLLSAYAERSGRSVPDLAGAVANRQLTLTWVERDLQPRDPGTPVAVLDVLYIEDDQSNLVLMRRIFGRWPTMHLDTTLTGGAGLEHIRRHPPDLVLLDGNLPDLDGREVLRQIREDPATADLPVIVISADANPERVATLLAEGANEYLTKPFDFDDLDDLINDLTAAARPATLGERT
jgi:CheY-like chemotaxis protein